MTRQLAERFSLASSLLPLPSSQAGVSGRRRRRRAGRKGMKAPGMQESLQESSQPRMYIRRFPVLAAAGIRMVSVPLSSGVEISRR